MEDRVALHDKPEVLAKKLSGAYDSVKQVRVHATQEDIAEVSAIGSGVETFAGEWRSKE